MKPRIKGTGYTEICLTKDGKKHFYLVHRLVAETYIPNPDGLPQVSHLDEDQSNNHVSNLTWATAKMNCNMPLHKQRKSLSQMNNVNSKPVMCVETQIVYASGSEAARQFKCTPQNIFYACKQNTIACGHHWRYA